MTHRLGRVAEALIARHPDLIAIQEIWFADDADTLEGDLAKHYVRVGDDAQIQQGKFAAFGFRSGGLLAFVRRDSRWQLLRGSEFRKYDAAAPWWHSGGDGLSDKGFQRFELKRQDGTTLQVFNTHLQSQYGDGKRYTYIRGDQIRQLNEAARESPSTAQVILGDFNTFPQEHGLYAAMTARWEDLTKRMRAECGCSGTSLDVDQDLQQASQTVEAEWIDYVLWERNSPVEVVDASRILSDDIDCPYSDHHGLDMVLLIAPQTGR